MTTFALRSKALYSSTIAHPNRGMFSIGALYFLGSASAFVWSYMPRYFESLGWSGLMVGLFFTMKTIGQTIATPIWAHWTDRNNKGREFIQMQHLAALAAAAMLPFMDSRFSMLVVALIFGITLRSSGPLIDAMAIDKAGMTLYGRLRAWGAMGFALLAIAASMAGMEISHQELAGLAPWLILALLVGSAVVTAGLPASERKETPPSQSLSEVFTLLKRPALMILLPVSAVYFALQAPYGLFLVSLAEERAFGAWVPGLAVGIGIAGEILAFAMAHLLLRRISPQNLLVIAMVATALRFYLTGLVTDPALFIGLQILHGLSFAVFYMALVQILTAETHQGNRNTGQALLYLLVFSVGAGAGTLLSGIAFDLLSASRLFRLAGLLNLLLLPLLLLSFQRSRKASPPSFTKLSTLLSRHRKESRRR